MKPPLPAPSTELAAVLPSPGPTPLWARLTNVLACPGEVLEEVAGSPPRWRYGLGPTLILALMSFSLATGMNPDVSGAAAAAGAGGEAGAVVLAARVRLLSGLAALLAVVAGTAWSALVLWCLGRACLRARFSYGKAVEMVALTAPIVALGLVVTALLGAATGHADARPALSWLMGGLPADHRVRLAGETVNVFHLWATAVLALGLSKLGGVSFKDGAFWVFGYWLVFKLVLVALA